MLVPTIHGQQGGFVEMEALFGFPRNHLSQDIWKKRTYSYSWHFELIDIRNDLLSHLQKKKTKPKNIKTEAKLWDL